MKIETENLLKQGLATAFIDSEDVQNFLKAGERGIDVELFVLKLFLTAGNLPPFFVDRILIKNDHKTIIMIEK